MALTVVSANFTWQEVKAALGRQANHPTQGTPGIAEVIVNQFRDLKAHLSQTKGNPNLVFVPFTALAISGANGVVLSDVPCKLYGVFGFKQTTEVPVYLHILDDAVNDAGVATDSRAMLAFLAMPVPETLDKGRIADAFYPNGLPMLAGVVAKAYTTPAGAGDSAAADCPNGFVILGAA